MIAVGDHWEWLQARRLLITVTEASLLHMKKETLLGRCACASVCAYVD